MAEDYEIEDYVDFDGTECDELTIGRRINTGDIEFATQDVGNSSAAVIAQADIWTVIDHLIKLAGPRP